MCLIFLSVNIFILVFSVWFRYATEWLFLYLILLEFTAVLSCISQCFSLNLENNHYYYFTYFFSVPFFLNPSGSLILCIFILLNIVLLVTETLFLFFFSLTASFKWSNFYWFIFMVVNSSGDSRVHLVNFSFQILYFSDLKFQLD